MTRLILVRHGESEANRKGVFAGHLDVDLMPKGMEQAQKTAEYIAKKYKVDKVYASDLVRAYKTGKAIADALSLGMTVDEGLREISAGKWEGVDFDTLGSDYKEDFYVWCTDVGNSRCTGGESVAELGERIHSELTKIAEENQNKTVVVATHATPIRAFQCIISGFSLDNMKDIPWVSNASVTEVTYDSGKWDIVMIGEDAHLSELKTSLPPNV